MFEVDVTSTLETTRRHGVFFWAFDMKRKSILLGGLLVLGLVTFADAQIVAHNGSDSSNPSPGTGPIPFGDDSVDVDFYSSDFAPGSTIKVFNEIATHEVIYGFQSGEPPVSIEEESVYNNTGELWDSYTIEIELAAFYELGEGSTGSPLGASVTIGNLDLRHISTNLDFLPSEIDVSISNSDFGAELLLDFADPLPSSLLDGFLISFDLGALSNPCMGSTNCAYEGFVMRQTPHPVTVIPAPGAALLASLGLSCITCFRRRFV